ncbi:MAG: DUF429 domain-containing protein [Rhodospirillaceae bacterium]|nr:DUF429 domain-containing protein [Rhodospirillaceae bacterium]
MSADSVKATILAGQGFERPANGTDRIGALVEAEREVIAHCIDRGPLYVDIPIDLQALNSGRATWVWELTRRPADFAFRALPPLADKIGAPVARFRHACAPVLRELGARLFETYPAASLQLLGIPSGGYKNKRVQRVGGAWQGDESLARIAVAMRLVAKDGYELNDDDLDSIVCALTGLVAPAQRLARETLEDEIAARLSRRLSIPRHQLPVRLAPHGYALIKALPFAEIVCERRDYEGWKA